MSKSGLHYILSLLLLLFVVSACATSDTPQEDKTSLAPVKFFATLNPATATIGDIVTWTLHLDYAEGVEVGFPEAVTLPEELTLVDSGEEKSSGDHGRTRKTRWFKVQAGSVGSYIFPEEVVSWSKTKSATDQQKPDDPNSGPQKIDQQNEVTADAVYLDIESTLPSDGEPQGLRDIKPLRPRPTTIPLWPLYLLIAVLLLGGLFSWLYRRFYKTKEIEAPPPVPAHKTANEGLTHLLSRWPVEDRAQRRLYFSASEILRIYVEARFELNASDLTTDEIVARLSNLKDLQQSEQTRLRQFLRASDRVKFAGDAPIENDFSALVEEARRFVGATRPTLSEQQQDGADQETTEATS